jgi:8-oxo-dGTP pyrophosphatase MutT (NUDIX family)
MIYCLRDGEVLLMHRHKQPNLGLWVAPGGKLEPGESPHACALRELREETGLRAQRLRFRGFITETSPRPDWQWMMFIYAATEFDGVVEGDEREGALKWWPLADLDAGRVPIPQGDAVFYKPILDLDGPFYQAHYVYDAALNLVEVTAQPV